MPNEDEVITDESQQVTDEVVGGDATLDSVVDEIITDVDGEGTGATPKPAVNEQGKPYYSIEEMRALDFSAIDTTRIPAEHQPFYKAMQASFTKSRQTESEKVRMLEEAVRGLQGQQKEAQMDPVDKAFNDFMQNPMKVEADFRDSINILRGNYRKALASYNNAEAAKALEDLEFLENTLNTFRDRKAQMDSFVGYARNIAMQANQAILQDIPDYPQVAEEMNQYIVSEGVDPRLTNVLSNAAIMDVVLKQLGIHDLDGITAVRQITKFVNSGYRRVVAGKTAEQKVSKVPPQTITPGTTEPSPARRVPEGEQRADFLKAKKTGDWRGYIMKYHAEV